MFAASKGAVIFLNTDAKPEIYSHLKLDCSTELPVLIDKVYASRFLLQSFLIDTEGAVWFFGYVRQGFDFGMDVSSTDNFVLNKIPLFSGLVISEVACGSFHMIFLDANGKMWGNGRNVENQLNFKDDESMGRITNVACGSFHSVFKNHLGELWGCGLNSHGQLALGLKHIVNVPTKIPLKCSAVQEFCCGANHTVLLDYEDKVWGVGANNNGQLGLNDQIGRDEFYLIESVPQIKRVYCGSYYTMMIDFDGQLWACGNIASALDASSSDEIFNKMITVPKRVPNIPKISMVGTGDSYNVLVDEEGELWTGFGRISFKDSVKTFKKIGKSINIANIDNQTRRFKNTKSARDRSATESSDFSPDTKRKKAE